jgi:hypothetical protein
MVRVWSELSDEEKEKLIREAKKLRVYGYGYVTIAKIFEERYLIKVSSATIINKLNPEKERKQRQQRKIIKSIIKNNRDYILEEIKKGFEEGKTKEEIANKLSKELNLPFYSTYYLTSGVGKIIKNPGKNTEKVLSVRECQYCDLIGIDYIKFKYALPILESLYGDNKRAYEALEKDSLTTDRIKGKQKFIPYINLRIPFSKKWIYSSKDKVFEIARKEALEYYEIFRSLIYLRIFKYYRFDEECEKAILSILSLPFVREDNENLKKLKEYKGVFNCLLRRGILKTIELDGRKYYSFWNYGLEDVKKLIETKN